MLQALQHLFGQLRVLGVVEPDMMLGFFARHKDILINVQIGEQAQLLMNDSDPVRAGLGGIPKGNLLIIHVQLAGAGLLNARDDFHQCGFSRSVFADQHVHLAPEHLKRHIVQRLGARVDLTDMLRPEADLLIIHAVTPYFTVICTGVMSSLSLPSTVKHPMNSTVFPVRDATFSGSSTCF